MALVRPIAAAVLLATLAAQTPAAGQSASNREQARDLGEQGFIALDHKDWAKAEKLFSKADSIYHAPTLLLGLARARAQLEKFVEAWDAYHRIIVEGAPPDANAVMRKAIASAATEIASVENRRARVVLWADGAQSPSVTLDGEPVPAAGLGSERYVNPGSHTARATAAGYKDAEQSFFAEEGKATTVRVLLTRQEPAHPSPPPPSGPKSSPGTGARTIAWVTVGVGAAGLAAGGLLGALAMGKHSTLAASPCSTAPCDAPSLASYSSDLDTYRTLGTASTIVFIAGGAIAATGLVLLLTMPRESRGGALQIAPLVGGGSVGARASF
jgi:hypothetical protein